jgi:hypothetical protein
LRKKEKEIKDRREIEAILQKASVCRLAMADGGEPYVVPLNFGYEGDCLYFHCAREGRKIDIIRRNDRVCFEVETDVQVIPAEKPCGWTTRFRCVIGRGRAVLVDDPAEKRRGLEVLMRHYGGPEGPFPDEVLAKTAVIRVDIEEMTGKESGWR